ncbi:MAG TPA: Cof-type HAD-IIB family hydrolase [Bacillales bacterium]|nr:Cof-type HAD-IIB family hydrolase [Bacillales bacterium]
MSETIRMIALDMDGTLLTNDGKISEANKKAIRSAQAAGIFVTLATGRNMHEIKPYAEQLHLEGPFISINGSVLWRNMTETWKCYTLDAKWVERMRELANQYEARYWGHSTIGGFRNHDFIEDIDSVEWFKFGFDIENAIDRAKILQTLKKWDAFEISNSSPTNIEVNPKRVHKAFGLRHVCELLQLPMRQVLAIGDSLNDLQMIKSAGIGVAMGNAQEAVKKAADHITETNENDGVATAIEKFVLIHHPR